MGPIIIYSARSCFRFFIIPSLCVGGGRWNYHEDHGDNEGKIRRITLYEEEPKCRTGIKKLSRPITTNKPQVANNIGCIHVVFKIVDSKDAVIKATRMYLRRILRATWIQPAVCS